MPYYGPLNARGKPRRMTEPEDIFYPCNKRETEILMRLKGEQLDEYKRLRNKGATVTEALDAVEKNAKESS